MQDDMETAEDVRYEILGGRKVAVLNCAEISNLEISRTIAAIKATKEDDKPFHVYNLTALVERFVLWHTKLPRVKPYYAVKCNNDPVLVRVLGALGAGFDCASQREIVQIVDEGINPSERIIYANPCKTRAFVKHASQLNVNMMTFDSAEELFKIKTEHNEPQMILRIAIGDPTAQCPLSVKFGCEPPMEEGTKLLHLAIKLAIPVVGISFHVGSGCNTPEVFRTAISIAKTLFDVGYTLGHDNMHILDIGGGFPGEDTGNVTFEKIADIVAPCLDEMFPVESGVEIIAEPGRFFAAATVSEAVNVIARKRVPASRITKNVEDGERNGFMYYVNDGVYGSFNCILFDHANPRGFPLFDSEDSNVESYPTTIWGPTCDGLDQVELSTQMREVQIGDWLYYPCMGAYTSVASTYFNGFEKPDVYYFIDAATWETLFGVAQCFDATGCAVESEEDTTELIDAESVIA